MKEPPTEHTGCTDMLFCSIRYEIGAFMRESKIFSRQWSFSAVSLAAKDKAIDELEERLETKYVRYCDPSIPLHFLSSCLARSAICQMRLLAHHPRQYPDKGASLPQVEKDMLFSKALQMIKYDNIGQTTETVQGFLWHMNVYLQLDAFIYLLGELRSQFEGENIDQAWFQVEQAFEHHPEILSGSKNPLYFAIGNLTLKAWDKRSAMRNGALYQPPTPRFISVLRLQRKIPDATPGDSRDRPPTPSGSQQRQAADMIGNWDMNFISNDIPMDASPMDWEYWQSLIDGTEFPIIDVNGQPLYPLDIPMG
jgi:hypothetical protein